jgi:hypothetical protein
MGRFFSALAALFALWTWTSQAHASNCAVDEYMHNNSLMEMQECDNSISISYIRPRPGMAKQGARDGSLLFDGRENNGTVTGTARLFSARCGVITYSVTGYWQGDNLILDGSAPIRGNGCRITRHRNDHLVFTPTAGGGGVRPPQTAQPSCPYGYYFDNRSRQCIKQNAGPAPSGGDWYAIAISTTSQSEARRKADSLGFGWNVMNTRDCPNFRNGYWIATAGPLSKREAQAYASASRGAYVKTCN